MSTNAPEADRYPLISVIIPCYKGEKFIAEAIDSVLNQTYQNFEIIVIDDGSPDDSVSVIQQYTHDSRLQYIRQTNGGMSSARNHGIQRSTGEFLVFLDQDDFLMPDAFEVGVRALQAHPDCGFVFGQSYLTDAEGAPLIQSSLEQVVRGNPPSDYEALLAGKGTPICPLAVALFRRSAVTQMGGFDATFGMADDYNLYLQVARRAPIYFHGAVSAAYRQHGENNSYRTVQMMDHLLKVMEAQQPYVSEHPQYQAAFSAGEAHWRGLFTAITLHTVIRHFLKGQLTPAVQLATSLVKSSSFRLSSIAFYWQWRYNIAQLKPVVKQQSVQSTEQLLSLMQDRYRYKTN